MLKQGAKTLFANLDLTPNRLVQLQFPDQRTHPQPQAMPDVKIALGEGRWGNLTDELLHWCLQSFDQGCS